MKAMQLIMNEILRTVTKLSELQEEYEIRNERSWGE